MSSVVQRAAVARAVDLLGARERSILRLNSSGGIDAVMSYLRATDRKVAKAAIAETKAKLEPLIQRELRRPAQPLPEHSSIAAPDTEPVLDRPALRSKGEIASSAPAKRKRPAYKEKPCVDCGQPFKPLAGRQVKCPSCRGEAPVHTRQVEPAPAPKAVEQAMLEAAGVDDPRVAALVPAAAQVESDRDAPPPPTHGHGAGAAAAPAASGSRRGDRRRASGRAGAHRLRGRTGAAAGEGHRHTTEGGSTCPVMETQTTPV